MSIKEYSLNLTKLPKYAPTMFANLRAMMTRFMSGVSNFLEKESRTKILFHDMDILCGIYLALSEYLNDIETHT